jgi:dipeptidyl aminopeptidase/acylaminoacyl peptidase
LDLANTNGTPTLLAKTDADFEGFSPKKNEAAFVANDSKGSRIWLSAAADATPHIIFETNTFLQRIAEGAYREFEYTSLDGETLKGEVILPINYDPAKRYPLICWVYMGRVQHERNDLSKISTLNPYNLQALAAKGYAVLFPSMPGTFDDYDKLLSGVLPAVDKVVQMGIADPQRVGVMGQSNGGFSTYGIITQSNRFKAAVAIAGMTDWSSIALEFEPPVIQRETIETGVTQGRLPFLEAVDKYGLPWSSRAYVKNSPITYVDRVQTPLLQLHGDLDGVPVQQAQEFFTALQRLGKRAEFVMYFGDGHVLHSSANIVDAWNRIFNWFDEYLAAP